VRSSPCYGRDNAPHDAVILKKDRRRDNEREKLRPQFRPVSMFLPCRSVIRRRHLTDIHLPYGHPRGTARGAQFDFTRWPTDGFFERLNERIKKQIEKVEDMTGDMDPKTNFQLVVIQTELERFKFLVRSYLRARIAKVCRFLSWTSSRRMIFHSKQRSSLQKIVWGKKREAKR
jgi:hypothetical protein